MDVVRNQITKTSAKFKSSGNILIVLGWFNKMDKSTNQSKNSIFIIKNNSKFKLNFVIIISGLNHWRCL